MKLMTWRRPLKAYNYLRCNDAPYFLCLSSFTPKGKAKLHSNIFFSGQNTLLNKTNEMKLASFHKIIIKLLFIGMKTENERPEWGQIYFSF